MNPPKPALSQILATAQLAEMAYNADQTEHKKDAWTKALGEYDQAKKEAERLEQPEEIPGHTFRLEDYQQLQEENSFLKSQLIEKEEKIKELEKLALSGKSTEPAITPVVAPAAPKPLTGAAKVAAEKAAAKAAAAEEAKKNS